MATVARNQDIKVHNILMDLQREKMHALKLRCKDSTYYGVACKCLICSNCLTHNMLGGKMSLPDDVVTNKKDVENSVQSRAAGRLNAIKIFFMTVIRQIGVFVLGIVIGMGIVLINPPEVKELANKIKVLEQEKASLAKSKDGNLSFKTSYELR